MDIHIDIHIVHKDNCISATVIPCSSTTGVKPDSDQATPRRQPAQRKPVQRKPDAAHCQPTQYKPAQGKAGTSSRDTGAVERCAEGGSGSRSINGQQPRRQRWLCTFLRERTCVWRVWEALATVSRGACGGGGGGAAGD